MNRLESASTTQLENFAGLNFYIMIKKLKSLIIKGLIAYTSNLMRQRIFQPTNALKKKLKKEDHYSLKLRSGLKKIGQ